MRRTRAQLRLQHFSVRVVRCMSLTNSTGHDAFRYEQRTHSRSGIGIKQDVTHFALSYHAMNRNAPALLQACDSATTLEKFGASNFYTL